MGKEGDWDLGRREWRGGCRTNRKARKPLRKRGGLVGRDGSEGWEERKGERGMPGAYHSGRLEHDASVNEGNGGLLERWGLRGGGTGT